MRADALAWSLYCKDSVSLWKGVSDMNSSKVPLVTKLGDSVGSKNIAQMWQDHFSALLNSVQNIDSKEFVCERIEHGIVDKEIVAVLASDVLDSLKTVKLPVSMAYLLSILCVHISVSVSTYHYYLHLCCLMDTCLQS